MSSVIMIAWKTLGQYFLNLLLLFITLTKLVNLLRWVSSSLGLPPQTPTISPPHSIWESWAFYDLVVRCVRLQNLTMFCPERGRGANVVAATIMIMISSSRTSTHGTGCGLEMLLIEDYCDSKHDVNRTDFPACIHSGIRFT